MSNQSSPFDLLDDMTALRLLEYLSLRKLLKLQTVCRRWNELIQSSWKRVTSLQFWDTDQDHTGSYRMEENRMSNGRLIVHGNYECFRWVLSNCGEFLRQLKLQHTEPKSLLAYIEHAVNTCSSLYSLTIYGTSVSPNVVRALTPIAPQLRIFKYILLYTTRKAEKAKRTTAAQREELKVAFEVLFSQMPNLIEVKLSSSDLEADKHGEKRMLRALPSSVKVVKLNLRGLNAAELKRFLQNTQVTDLHIRLNKELMLSNGLAAIADAASKLKQLTLAKDYKHEYSLWHDSSWPIPDFSPLKSMHSLLKLAVSFSNFSNHDLMNVCTGCPLLTILIIGDTGVTDVGLCHISSLIQLQVLDIRGLKKVTGKVFVRAVRRLGQLRKLCLEAKVCSANELVLLAGYCPHLESVTFYELTTLKPGPEAMFKFARTLMTSSQRVSDSCKIAHCSGGLYQKIRFTQTQWPNVRVQQFEKLCRFARDATTCSDSSESITTADELSE